MDQRLVERAKQFITGHLRRNAEVPPTIFVATAAGIKAFPLSSTPIRMWNDVARKAVVKYNGYACALATSAVGFPGNHDHDTAMIVHSQAGSTRLLYQPYTLDSEKVAASGMWVEFHEHPHLCLLEGVLNGPEL